MTRPDDEALRAVGELPDWLEEQVLAALEGDDAAREEAIAGLLARNPAHADAVRRWLAATDAGPAGGPPPSATTSAAPAGAPPGDGIPDRIGAYRILRRLGRGHFGTVWLAEQVEPIRRRVAVKVLNPGMDTGDVLARFAGEREALNRMDHPCIARLLDAGATDEGRPFFVMEYVPGEPLGRFCRSHELPLRARLELFLQVLDAVQHAHQRAVIHRDLSTNNVLVTEVDGARRPKIIDFGIAKSLTAPLVEGGLGTLQGTLMGTPEFMSPEQARGRPEDIDTRADIYALGVQLYELLTDELPIPTVVLRSQGIAGMEKLIRTHVPPHPSQAAPEARAAALRGDLDCIAEMALAKDPDDRYPTVGAFAADLRRYLDNEPIAARAPSTWYRLRKFARRNVVQVTAAATALLGLLVALGITLYALGQTRKAREAAEQARAEVKQRADEGFRLLANLDRLQEARESAARLYPPWPDQVPALRAWLAQLAEPLLQDLPRMRSKLAELRPKAPDGFDDPAQQHLWMALTRLERDVSAFAASGGELESVRRRLQWAETIARRSIDEHRERWQVALAAVKASDGVRSSALYRGCQLAPQIGLVPLGMNPESRLWEFLDLASHASSAPLPDRDPATGQLRVRPDTGIVFVLLPPGEPWIGARRGEPGLEQNDPQAEDDETPIQAVMLQPFLLARTELTQEQWAALTGGDRPARHSGAPALPVEGVDWNTAAEVLDRWGMTLPTEAQWEYACRAGTRTPWHFGADPAATAAGPRFGQSPHTVALFPPNAFGLFDMHGNVAEWCRDRKAPYAQVAARRNDGLRDQPQGELRALRGGACAWPVRDSRASARRGLRPETRDAFVGLRPARDLVD